MTANQRRPGFRLPWSPETEGADGDAEQGTPEEEQVSDQGAEDTTVMSTESTGTETAADAAPAGDGSPAAADAEATVPAAEAPDAASPEMTDAPAAPTPHATATPPESGGDFMRDLVAAMRKVADEARQGGIADLQARADEQVRRLDADAERRRDELRARAEADVAAVAEWAEAETQRIKAEAEQRVVSRRSQLDQQLSADKTRTEDETRALRARVTEYERELDAYHDQLAGISDPAAFAAAAKRMPSAPSLTQPVAVATTTAAPTEAPEAAAGSNGVGTGPEMHPVEEVLATRLAELDAALPAESVAAAAERAADGAPASGTEPMTTEVVVKGLGSFGAITGFRQALSGVDGIAAVALSLGQTGEFVFRATHAPGFDLRAAIVALEGDGAKIEERPEGGLRVTLDRAR